MALVAIDFPTGERMRVALPAEPQPGDEIRIGNTRWIVAERAFVLSGESEAELVVSVGEAMQLGDGEAPEPEAATTTASTRCVSVAVTVDGECCTAIVELPESRAALIDPGKAATLLAALISIESGDEEDATPAEIDLPPVFGGGEEVPS